MWVQPYTWLEPLSEIQRRPHESRVSQTDPVSGLPQPNVKKSLFNCFNFTESHFTRVSNIPWDRGRIKLYLSCNTYSGILQRAGYYNVKGTKPAPFFFSFFFLIWRQQMKTALGDRKTSHIPSCRIQFLRKLLWPKRLLFLQRYSTQELCANCSDQQ